MKPPAFRVLCALTAIATLAACAGGSGVTPSTDPASVPLSMSLTPTVSNSPSPCAMKHGWTFHGPCEQFDLPSWPPTTIKLGPYQSLKVATIFGGQSSDGTALVLGLGTSDTDITGKIRTVFPLYGSNGGCTNFYGYRTKCKGKGFLYELFMIPPSNTRGI